MAKEIFKSSLRDTSTDTDYTEQTGHEDDNTLLVTNTHDAEVTAEFYGTRDQDEGSWNDEVKLGEEVLSDGSSTQQNAYETLSDAWDIVRVKATASTSPSSGEVVVWKMGRM